MFASFYSTEQPAAAAAVTMAAVTFRWNSARHGSNSTTQTRKKEISTDAFQIFLDKK
jgi:hypothetical protein